MISAGGGNVALYPWFKFCQSLVFWQAIWFLYFQNQLSAGEAIVLYAVYDVGTTLLEVPSGYMSDRIGRRFTLVASAVAGILGGLLLAFGSSFAIFATAQVLLGASSAFASGTDNALLYESLVATNRKSEIEAQELRAWRFSFTALALSAMLGGVLYQQFEALPFMASAVAFTALLVITLKFQEPVHRAASVIGSSRDVVLRSLRQALTEPVLAWLFALGVLMYVFSHIPFVFGQPFILEALRETGFAADAPIVSGVVSATMMIISVVVSLFALRLRRYFGLARILLLAFFLQIALIGTLALTIEAIAIAVLFLRMVPDSLSRPFVIARIQPALSDQTRATYMSLRSFVARLAFAATLLLASSSAPDNSPLSYQQIQPILVGYTLAGLIFLVLLVVTARLVKLDSD